MAEVGIKPRPPPQPLQLGPIKWWAIPRLIYMVHEVAPITTNTIVNWLSTTEAGKASWLSKEVTIIFTIIAKKIIKERAHQRMITSLSAFIYLGIQWFGSFHDYKCVITGVMKISAMTWGRVGICPQRCDDIKGESLSQQRCDENFLLARVWWKVSKMSSF